MNEQRTECVVISLVLFNTSYAFDVRKESTKSKVCVDRILVQVSTCDKPFYENKEYCECKN
jgi:hypothetical protein